MSSVSNFFLLLCSLSLSYSFAASFREEDLITSIKLLPEEQRNNSLVSNLSTDSSEEDSYSGKRDRTSSEEDMRRIKEREEAECHRSAVWRCGHILIRIHKFFDYLPSRESFHPKCAVRNAFFNCLKVSKEKSCGRNRKKVPNSDKFRQRLANTLWSTRTCLLGLEYYG